jgi:hypothetical protein
MTIPQPPDRKEVENRTWPFPPTMIGKRFAIHAAKSWDENGARHIHEAGLRFPPMASITRGAIVALATIDHQVIADGVMPTRPPYQTAGTLPDSQKRWFFGPYGFVFVRLSVLPKPIIVRGMQGFWTVPINTEREVIDQLLTHAREWCTSHCQYTAGRTEAILKAVRRTGRHGRELDDAAWSAASDHGVPPEKFFAEVAS